MLLGAEELLLRSATQGTYGADGRFVPGTTLRSKIRASVQPLSGEDMATLEEGERYRDWRKLYVHPNTVLRTVDQYGTAGADKVEIDGVEYQVRTVFSYRAGHPIPHRKVLVRRFQE